jgi:hypothetical protein
MRHDFGFMREGARRLQRRHAARARLARIRAGILSRRLTIAAIALVTVAIPGRALVALVLPS